MRKVACDACYRRKERCRFDASEGLCRQCRLQRKTCSFERRGRRIGRPPVARKVPYGTFGILSFEMNENQPDPPQASEASAPSEYAGICGRENVGEGDINSVIDKSQGFMFIGPEEIDNTDSAGESVDTDRVKEPVDLEEIAMTTNGADIEDSIKTCDIPELPDLNSFDHSLPPLSTYEFSLASLFTPLGALPDHSSSWNLQTPQCQLVATRYRHVHRFLLDRQTFWSYHRDFMICPSFSDGFRGAIMTVLTRSGGLLWDAYLPVLALWDEQVHTRARAPGEIDPREGTYYLKQLQTPAVADAHDAAAVIMVGQVLLLYHIVLLGTSAHAIVRKSLLVAEDWFSSLLVQRCLDPITITPIFTDTIECLIRREVPVVQYPYRDCPMVDRTAGLCVGLLHIHYELCEISHRAKVAACGGPGSAYDCTHPRSSIQIEDVAHIESRVRRWEPLPPPGFFKQYSSLEVSAMLLQARVYRLATLLIIHRLQYPLGVGDETALWLASTIAAELECFVEWVPEEMQVGIGLPLLVSSVELDSVSDRVFTYMSPCSRYGTGIKNFANLAKAARDNGYRGLWFDLVDGGLHIPVLP